MDSNARQKDTAILVGVGCVGVVIGLVCVIGQIAVIVQFSELFASSDNTAEGLPTIPRPVTPVSLPLPTTALVVTDTATVGYPAPAPQNLPANTPAPMPTATPMPTPTTPPTPIPTQPPAPTTPPATAPAPATQGYAVGDTVEVGQARWVVTEVEDLGDTVTGQMDDVTTSGKFVLVRLDVENLDKEQHAVPSPKLRDDQGREYGHSSDIAAITQIDGDSCVLEMLNPNLPKTCTILYDIPADSQGLMLVAQSFGLFSDEEQVISLGL